MPLEEKSEKKSAKRAPSDPPIALFDSKQVFWNCEKEEKITKWEKIYSPSVHATRTPSDTPKSLIEDSEVSKSSATADSGSVGLPLGAHKKQQQLSPETSKKSANMTTALEPKVVVVLAEPSSKSNSSHSQQQLLKVVPSRFSSTQLLKSRKSSMDSISSSWRRQPKSTLSQCLQSSAPNEITLETLPQYVQDVVVAFVAKQPKQYTHKM